MFSSQLYLFMFLLVAFILLLNLLIAMMGDTYTRIAEIKNEWMRQVDIQCSRHCNIFPSNVSLYTSVGPNSPDCGERYSSS